MIGASNSCVFVCLCACVWQIDCRSLANAPVCAPSSVRADKSDQDVAIHRASFSIIVLPVPLDRLLLPSPPPMSELDNEIGWLFNQWVSVPTSGCLSNACCSVVALLAHEAPHCKVISHVVGSRRSHTIALRWQEKLSWRIDNHREWLAWSLRRRRSSFVGARRIKRKRQFMIRRTGGRQQVRPPVLTMDQGDDEHQNQPLFPSLSAPARIPFELNATSDHGACLRARPSTPPQATSAAAAATIQIDWAVRCASSHPQAHAYAPAVVGSTRTWRQCPDVFATLFDWLFAG